MKLSQVLLENQRRNEAETDLHLLAQPIRRAADETSLRGANVLLIP